MKKKKNTDNEVDDENDKKVIRRTLRLARSYGTGIHQRRQNLPNLRFVHEQLCAPLHYFRAAPTATAV